MDDLRWMKFWPADWQRDPAVRMCGLAARGLWIEMICVMHEADPYGHMLVNGRAPTTKQLGALFGVSEREVKAMLAELETSGVFSRTDDGTIYSRRMVKDEARRVKARTDGSKGGNPTLKPNQVNGGVNPKDNPASNSGLSAPLNPLEAEAEKEVEAEKKDISPTPHHAAVKPRKPRASLATDDPDFVEFWQRYPRPEGKGAARKAWTAAMAKAAPGQILAALDRAAWNPDPRYIPHPATWLNQERWTDAAPRDPVLSALGLDFPRDEPEPDPLRLRLQ